MSDLKDRELPEAVIVMMAYGRAGSGLWSSLLDDHPNLIMLPDCVISNFYAFWERHKDLSAGEVTSAFIEYYSVIFDARQDNDKLFPRFHRGDFMGFCKMGPNKDEVLFVDTERFQNEMAALIDFDKIVTRRLFFQAVHVAYARALGRDFSDPAILFGLHVSSEDVCRLLVEDFPKTVFIQTVREPVKGMASWFRHFDRTQDLPSDMFLRALDMAIETGRYMPKDHRMRWFGVRLEDIHANPEPTIRQVTTWLGLPWSPTLLLSTFNGLIWWNEKGAIEVSGFSDKITSQTYDKYLTEFDRRRLGILLGLRGHAWGYDYKPYSPLKRSLIKLSFLLPFEMERLCWRSEASSGLRKSIKMYKRARKKMFAAMRKGVRYEVPIISDITNVPDAPVGRELLRVGGPDSQVRETFLENGKAMLDAGKTEEAVTSFSVAIACEKNDEAAYGLRADAYRAVGNIQLANVDRARAGLPQLAAE